MDLVSEAGIEVSDWWNYAKGPDAAVANPKYRYEWAYASADVVVPTCGSGTCGKSETASSTLRTIALMLKDTER